MLDRLLVRVVYPFFYAYMTDFGLVEKIVLERKTYK